MGLYSYGFQGQEKDDEISGSGDAVNFRFRMYDPRLGRFKSTDPLEASFAWNSPFAFSENRVIDAIELEGAESLILSEIQPSISLDGMLHTVSEEVVQAEWIVKAMLQYPSGGIENLHAFDSEDNARLNEMIWYWSRRYGSSYEERVWRFHLIWSLVYDYSFLAWQPGFRERWEEMIDNALTADEKAALIAARSLEIHKVQNTVHQMEIALNAITVCAGSMSFTRAPTIKPKSFSYTPRGTIAKPINGNSLNSTKTQHGYKIIDKRTGEVQEYGISGQKLNKDGTSPRIQQKLRTKYNNDPNYEGVIIKTGMPNRRAAVKWEKSQVRNARKSAPSSLPQQKRPSGT